MPLSHPNCHPVPECHTSTRSLTALLGSLPCRHCFAEPLVQIVPADKLVSEPIIIKRFDLLTMHAREQDIVKAPFAMPIAATTSTAPVTVHGITLWFDVDFTGRSLPANAAALTPGTVSDVSTSSTGDASVSADSSGLPPLEDSESSAPTSSSSSAVSVESISPFSDVHLSTSPAAKPTHWMQTTLLLRKPLSVAPGAVVGGMLTMVRDPVNPREYRFQLEVTSPAEGATVQSYHMQ